MFLEKAFGGLEKKMIGDKKTLLLELVWSSTKFIPVKISTQKSH
jgi:hypothetical protein